MKKEVVKNSAEDGLLAQYKECNENWRHYDKVIWQIPSFTTAIDGALIVAAYAYVNVTDVWSLLVREILICVALVLNVSLTYALIKYRFFVELATATLDEIEKAMRGRFEIKIVQRHTIPQNGEYWHKKIPKRFQKHSSHRLLIGAMFFLCAIITFLMCFNVLWYFLLN